MGAILDEKGMLMPLIREWIEVLIKDLVTTPFKRDPDTRKAIISSLLMINYNYGGRKAYYNYVL